MRDFRDAKAMARILRAALAAKGLKITISQSLELIAELFGEPDWNTLAAAIRAEGTARPSSAPSPPQSAEAATAPGAPGPLLSRAFEPTVDRALAYANQRDHAYATLEHLLLALTDDEDASAVMEGCKVDPAALKQHLTNYIDNELTTLVIDEGPSRPTAAFQRVIQRAVIQVQSTDREEVTGADVLVAIFAERESHAVYFLGQQAMSRYDAVNYISHGIAKGSREPPTRRRRHRRSPTDAAIPSNVRETTTRVPASLTPREEHVLRLRFGIGIDMNTDHTLEQVGQQFSVTQERIRQIEARALRKLKHPSRSPEAEKKGEPRQGFSHGRSKPVVVEKNNRRRPPRNGTTAKKTPPASPK